jgi:phage gp29-like protein
MHNAAISTRCVEIALKIRCADEVDDDVDALTVGRFEDLLRPVLGMVVEASSCTEFLRAEVNLLLRPSCYVDS